MYAIADATLDRASTPTSLRARRERRARSPAANVTDFAHCEGIVVVCAPKSHLRAHDLAQDLATVLDAWASTNADPYVGLHWPFPPSGKRR